MKIFLNGHELEKQAEGTLEVGQVLNEVQTEIHRGGKVLLSAAMDGVPIEQGFRRRRQLATPVTRVARLDLMIQEPQVVSQQILNDSLQMFRQVQQEVAPLATSFRIGDEAQANQSLAEIIERLTLSLKGASLVLQRSQTTANAFAQLNQAGQQLMPVVDRILSAQAAGDYTALADELEYEMPQVLRECYVLLQKLARAAEFEASQSMVEAN